MKEIALQTVGSSLGKKPCPFFLSVCFQLAPGTVYKEALTWVVVHSGGNVKNVGYL